MTELTTLKELFPEIPHLSGEGITLKAVTLADKEGLQEMVNSPAVQKHLPTFLFEQQYDDMEYVINQLYDECLEDSLILGIYKDNGAEFCGLAEMYGYNPQLYKISLGCRLRESCWRQGIVARALRLMTDYLYNEKGIEIITASTMVVNKPAAKAAAAAGFDLVVQGADEDWGYPKPPPPAKWIR